MNKNIRMEDLPIYEIEVDEEGNQGIRMISLVADPAISVMGMYFSSDIEKEYRFKAVKDQQIIVGPAMIPDKKILRKDNNDNYYYVYFTKETIRKMVQKFVKENNNQSLNIDHSNKMVPGFIQSSWIVEDPTYDKSRFYGFNLPIGSYFIEVKIEDKDFWLSEIKEEGKYGFSVEGLMGQKLVEMESVIVDAPKYIDELIDILKEEDLAEIMQDFQESYNDYPKAATENAKIALRYAEENGWGSCGTPVGKARANQLAKGESITRETIARMAAFERHRQNSQKELGDGCGRLMWLAWGGDAGVEWAQRKLKQIDNQDFEFKVTIDSVRSTNVKRVKYDSVTEEMTIRFDDGSIYTYFDIPSKIYDNVLEGMAGTKTAGEWGPIGKFPSVGAAVWQYLVDGGFRYKKGGSMKFESTLITCKECGHQWYLEDGGDNPYTCNKCNKEQEFIVEPKAGETKDEFVSRCIGVEINSGKEQDQAASICYAKWENK